MSPPGFPEAVAALGRALDRLGRPWMVIGGLAVIAHGVPRTTLDADATVSGPGLVPVDALRALEEQGIVARIPDAAQFAGRSHVLLVRHEASGVPIDISLAWLPFEDEALARAVRREFAGATLPFVQPEDLVIYKLVAARPRDLEDAERLLVLHGTRMDLARVADTVDAFCDVLEDACRRQLLATLFERAGLPPRPLIASSDPSA
jgi:hypothetical protein